MPPMLRALFAVAFALLPAVALAQAQQQPPPDTKPARERHRLQEKQPPPPEGPWGPEEVGFTWHAPVWRGLIGAVGTYGGNSISMNAPRGLVASSDGVNPPIFETVEYHGENFRTTSGTVTADLDVFRLSLSGFSGTFDAHATFNREDGVSVQSQDLDLHGDVFGFRLGVYWPAFRYRDALLEGSLGPTATVGWMHQETDQVPGQLLKRDTLDILTGSFGPKASFRLLYDRWALEVDAEYTFLTGAARGWTREFSVGLGYKF